MPSLFQPLLLHGNLFYVGKWFAKFCFNEKKQTRSHYEILEITQNQSILVVHISGTQSVFLLMITFT